MVAPEGYNEIVILQTERLILRRFKPADLTGLIDMFADSQVMKYIGPRRAMTQSEIQAWLSDKLHRQAHELTRYAVALKTTDELIGVAGVQVEAGIKDFGYYFRRSYWGQGYAREACAALLNYLEINLKIRDYEIFIADGNASSIRVMAKLGMQATKRVTRSGEQGHLYERIHPD
ncbi:MAG TPA: GNAT family N-acetyltransferase [Anaerolineales bacterium]|nr:GNAT family N-acetyltransferase [Anaerolineales bacterium]